MAKETMLNEHRCAITYKVAGVIGGRASTLAGIHLADDVVGCCAGAATMPRSARESEKLANVSAGVETR
jgi:hypothetical protein